MSNITSSSPALRAPFTFLDVKRKEVMGFDSLAAVRCYIKWSKPSGVYYIEENANGLLTRIVKKTVAS